MKELITIETAKLLMSVKSLKKFAKASKESVYNLYLSCKDGEGYILYKSNGQIRKERLIIKDASDFFAKSKLDIDRLELLLSYMPEFFYTSLYQDDNNDIIMSPDIHSPYIKVWGFEVCNDTELYNDIYKDPTFGFDLTLQINSKKLCEAFKFCEPALSNDIHTPALCDYYLEVKKGTAYLYATNCKILQKCFLDIDLAQALGDPNKELQLYIPKDVAKYIKDKNTKNDYCLSFYQKDRSVYVDFEGSYNITYNTLVEGKYPNVESAFPQNFDYKYVIDRTFLLKLLNAHKVSNCKSKNKYNSNENILTLSVDGCHFTFESKDADSNSFLSNSIEAFPELCCSHLKMGLDCKQLVQILESVGKREKIYTGRKNIRGGKGFYYEDDEVTISFSTPSSPVLITYTKNKNTSLLMPKELDCPQTYNYYEDMDVETEAEPATENVEVAEVAKVEDVAENIEVLDVEAAQEPAPKENIEVLEQNCEALDVIVSVPAPTPAYEAPLVEVKSVSYDKEVAIDTPAPTHKHSSPIFSFLGGIVKKAVSFACKAIKKVADIVLHKKQLKPEICEENPENEGTTAPIDVLPQIIYVEYVPAPAPVPAPFDTDLPPAPLENNNPINVMPFSVDVEREEPQNVENVENVEEPQNELKDDVSICYDFALNNFIKENDKEKSLLLLRKKTPKEIEFLKTHKSYYCDRFIKYHYNENMNFDFERIYKHFLSVFYHLTPDEVEIAQNKEVDKDTEIKAKIYELYDKALDHYQNVQDTLKGIHNTYTQKDFDFLRESKFDYVNQDFNSIFKVLYQNNEYEVFTYIYSTLRHNLKIVKKGESGFENKKRRIKNFDCNSNKRHRYFLYHINKEKDMILYA